MDRRTSCGRKRTARISWASRPIPEGVTVLTRLCGFNDRSLVSLLQDAGLPLVFAASDHPY